MTTTNYERTFYLTLGWEVAGRTLAGLRARCYQLGIEDRSDLQWPKTHELLKTYEIVLAGDQEVVDGLIEDYLERYPLDQDGRMQDAKDQ